jgi:DNA-binding transcriptional LysR family regulator
VLDEAALALAADAWAAFRSDDPRRLTAIATARTAGLRFLPEAFERLGREFPSTRDGLSLTERRVLAAVADGAATAGEAHVRASAREARPYLGDALLFRIVDRLAAGRSPLLLTHPAGATGAHTGLELTPAGGRVLRGEADHVDLNGIDRWVGGVHLTGNRVRWRFDEGTEAVVAA